MAGESHHERKRIAIIDSPMSKKKDLGHTVMRLSAGWRGCPILCLLAKGGGRMLRAMIVTLVMPYDTRSVPHPAGVPEEWGTQPCHTLHIIDSPRSKKKDLGHPVEDTGRWRLPLGLAQIVIPAKAGAVRLRRTHL